MERFVPFTLFVSDEINGATSSFTKASYLLITVHYVEIIYEPANEYDYGMNLWPLHDRY